MPRNENSGEEGVSPPEPWASFLRALDVQLDESVDLHCLGGFAMTMQYGVSRTTADIDILPAVSSRILALLEKLAGKGSKLSEKFKVYIQPVTVATYPEDYESRLVRMWPKLRLKKLRLFALEPHDLALTKLERNSDVDRQDVLDLAAAGLINAKTLRRRYAKEFRPNLVSGEKKHDKTLDLWVEMCWPSGEGR
jgi:uncharacterized nucleotidyltransferase DUF6036